MTAKPQKKIIIGCLGAVHGLKGWMKVNSFTQPNHNIFSYNPWLLHLSDDWLPIKITQFSHHGKNLIAHIPGYDDCDSARALVHTEIAIYREQLPKLPKGEFYWTDLEGLTVINEQGVYLGVVDYLLNTGANDILMVEGKKQYLIPYVFGQFVTQVDLEKQEIHVVWDAEF